MIDERLVVDRKFTGQPVDEQGEKPTENEKRTPVTGNRPVADPRLSIRPVDVVAFERMPRYVQVDNESILGRPTEGEKSHPSTVGRQAKHDDRTKGGDGSPGNCHPTVPCAPSF